MASQFGNKLKISVFGESHGRAIGVAADGFPAGETVDTAELRAFLARRSPGKSNISSARCEADEPVFLSGIIDGRTEGTPLCAIIENKDARPGDYQALAHTPRPGHADLAAWLKWGEAADMRGGGHFSGRLTAPLCIAGGIAKQILARRGIFAGAHLLEAAGIEDEAFPMLPGRELFEETAAKAFPVISDAAGEKMRAAIAAAASAGDSVGGVVECAVTGLPAGLGGPMFGGMESRLAQALFGIPAVKGVEFGRGFESARMRGSENNDRIKTDGFGNISLASNNCGGILGGITCGMPVVFRMAVKPAPSIAKKQMTVDLLTLKAKDIEISGRHDPCIAPRAVPVAEAAAALVILDMLLEEGK